MSLGERHRVCVCVVCMCIIKLQHACGCFFRTYFLAKRNHMHGMCTPCHFDGEDYHGKNQYTDKTLETDRLKFYFCAWRFNQLGFVDIILGVHVWKNACGRCLNERAKHSQNRLIRIESTLHGMLRYQPDSSLCFQSCHTQIAAIYCLFVALVEWLEVQFHSQDARYKMVEAFKPWSHSLMKQLPTDTPCVNLHWYYTAHTEWFCCVACMFSGVCRMYIVHNRTTQIVCSLLISRLCILIS